MTPSYLNPTPPLPQMEANNPIPGQDHLLFAVTAQTLAPPSSDHREPPQHQGDQFRCSAGGTAARRPEVGCGCSQGGAFRIAPASISRRSDDPQNSSYPAQWMSSKMRIMRKMMNSDRAAANSSASPNDQSSLVRVCSDCHTTKTPLWRSGPRGPKSLCNACGIRQRKARRAMAMAAAGGGIRGMGPSDQLTDQGGSPKEAVPERNCTIQYKKRHKLSWRRSKKKLQFDDFMVMMSKNPSFQEVFPQDERDAAVLLMALSCGLVLS